MSRANRQAPYAIAIRRLRDQHKITLAATALGVADLSDRPCTASAVSKWEHGKNPPSYLHAVALEKLFKVADNELLDVLGYEPMTPGVSNQDIIDRIDDLGKLVDGIAKTMTANTAALRQLVSDPTPSRGLPSPSATRPAPRRADRPSRQRDL